MNYFRGLFRNNTKDSCINASPSQGGHHHSGPVSIDRPPKECTHHSEEFSIKQASSHPQEGPSLSEPNEDVLQTNSDSQPLPEVHAYQTSSQQERPPLHEGLHPAYRYTCGDFSETISREEAMLARQYSFSSPSDRGHAVAVASTTRYSVRDSKSGEFDSIFKQFIHGIADQ